MKIFTDVTFRSVRRRGSLATTVSLVIGGDWLDLQSLKITIYSDKQINKKLGHHSR